MTREIIFQDSFSVVGIMCHSEDGCGVMIQTALNSCLDEYKAANPNFPQDAQLNIDAEPQSLGIHRLFIQIEGEGRGTNVNQDELSDKIKASLPFDILDNSTENQKDKSGFINWVNILVNSTVISAISIISAIFPPSLLLTIGLTSLSFLSTAFTAKAYLINFFVNLRNKHFTTMETAITLGWFLSLAHTLYHSISMPLMSSFSMTFMSFIMPVILITVINGMDEIKRLILNKSKKMHLKGMQTLFPEMAQEYDCYPLSQEKSQLLGRLERLLQEKSKLSDRLKKSIEENNGQSTQELQQTLQELQPSINQLFQAIQTLPEDGTPAAQQKNILKKGMVIQVKQGECFPVDCFLVEGNTLVNASLLTGEPQKSKKSLDSIPAGAINLGPPVRVYATASAYNSTVNRLLFRSNRGTQKAPASTSVPIFTYLYSILIFLGIATSILLPVMLGIFTVPLLLQNVIGILFAVCPCTVAIAHQLPNLLSIYHRGNKGITLRDENLAQQTNEIHTVVFDKTGTLTTGNSEVESFEDFPEDNNGLWERIYLLETQHGAGHPLAKAITNYYKALKPEPTFTDINEPSIDNLNRGLSAMVQNRRIHIGNAAYLTECGITLPTLTSNKLAQGFSPVYIAEDNVYKGVIFIKHEIRSDTVATLSRLKNEGKKIIMLTGDNLQSAIGFNQQLKTAAGLSQLDNDIFDVANIHAEQTPEKKEGYLTTLISAEGTNPKGVWFVGDGLNDAPCARVVSEKGGVSCAMTSDDKAAFFSDISLNGSLKYLFEHNNLNRLLKKYIFQNQGLLIYSLIVFLAFTITFSITGIAVSPLIPLVIMVSTTLFTLFNSYRIQLSIDNALDKNTSWLKQFLASDLSISLLLGASFLLSCSVLISTVALGALAIPSIVFTAGTLATLSSVCILTATVMVASFVLLGTAYLFTGGRDRKNEPVANNTTVADLPATRQEPSLITTLPVVNNSLAEVANSEIEEPPTVSTAFASSP